MHEQSLFSIEHVFICETVASEERKKTVKYFQQQNGQFIWAKKKDLCLEKTIKNRYSCLHDQLTLQTDHYVVQFKEIENYPNE